MLRWTSEFVYVTVIAAALCGCEPRTKKHTPPPKPAMVHVGPGPLAAQIKAKRARAASDNAILIVYVGAAWCQPCKHFKRALAAGELNTLLPGLRMIELDDDKDAERLRAAGYNGEMIPRFVIPAADGRATDQRIEGSIKGPGSPAEIVPRLRRLIANSR